MSSISALYFWSAASVLVGATLLGSSSPIAGTNVASMVWKGAATKRPAASNHSEKGRESFTSTDLPDFLGVTFIVRL